MKDIQDTAAVQTQILDAFNFRHACKVFDDERKIDAATFDTILEAARLSPTSFGHEPYKILMIQNPENRALLRDFAWGANGATNGTAGQLGTASHFAVLLAHTGETMTAGSDYLQNFYRDVKQLPEDVIAFLNDAYGTFQSRDHGVSTPREITDWSGKQAYIVLANMMTTGALLGVDSCPIEGFEMDKTVAVLEQYFGVDPKLYKPAVMVAFGYRADEPAFDKTRRNMDQIVEWA
jgi:nitroreductase